MDRHLCLSMTWSILSLIHVNVSWLKCETADNVIKGKFYTNIGLFIPISKSIVLHYTINKNVRISSLLVVLLLPR